MERKKLPPPERRQNENDRGKSLRVFFFVRVPFRVFVPALPSESLEQVSPPRGMKTRDTLISMQHKWTILFSGFHRCKFLS